MRTQNTIQRFISRVYLLIITLVVIPALVTGSIYIATSYNKRTQKSETVAEERLVQLKTQLDLTFRSLEYVGAHFNSNFNAFTTDSEICRQLSVYENTYDYIISAAYLGTGGMRICTSSGIVEYNAYRDFLLPGINLDISFFYTKMNSVLKPCVSPLHKERASTPDSDFIVFMQPVPMLENVRKGCLALIVNTDVMHRTFENCVGDYAGNFYVLDENAYPLYMNSITDYSYELSEEMLRLRGTGLFKSEINGEKYVLTRIISDVFGGFYLSAVKASDFYEDVFYTHVYLSVALLCGAVLMSALIWLVLKSLYKPILELSAEMGLLNMSVRHPGAALQQAGQLYLTATSERKQIEQHAETLRDALLRQLTDGLIHGYLSDDAVRQYVEETRINWKGGVFVALCAKLSTYDEYERALAVCEDDADALVYIGHDSIAAIICTGAPLEGEALAAFASRYAQFTRIGIGKPVGTLKQVSLSYLQAQAALKVGEGYVCQYEGMSTAELADMLLPRSEKAFVLYCMKDGRTAPAVQALDELLTETLPFSDNRVLVRSLSFYLTDGFVNATQEMQLNVNCAPLYMALESGELNAFFEALKAFVSEACMLQERRKAAGHEAADNKIIAYVNENYTDYAISLENLSDQFGVSVSYITRMFKQKTGYTFLQYISQMRMDRVKRLLESTQTPINEIITGSGYADPANFIRKFKQMEGITPGQYREKFQNANEMSQNDTSISD